jgi:hypothetical protein
MQRNYTHCWKTIRVKLKHHLQNHHKNFNANVYVSVSINTILKITFANNIIPYIPNITQIVQKKVKINTTFFADSLI